MAPKLHQSDKLRASRAATRCLQASEEVELLDKQREQVKKQVRALAAARKREAKKIQNMKKKCTRMKLGELLDIVMMKSVQIEAQEQLSAATSGAASSSSSSSSGGSTAAAGSGGGAGNVAKKITAWRPDSAAEAISKIAAVVDDKRSPFGKSKSKAKKNQQPETTTQTPAVRSEPVEDPEDEPQHGGHDGEEEAEEEDVAE